MGVREGVTVASNNVDGAPADEPISKLSCAKKAPRGSHSSGSAGSKPPRGEPWVTVPTGQISRSHQVQIGSYHHPPPLPSRSDNLFLLLWFAFNETRQSWEQENPIEAMCVHFKPQALIS